MTFFDWDQVQNPLIIWLSPLVLINHLVKEWDSQAGEEPNSLKYVMALGWRGGGVKNLMHKHVWRVAKVSVGTFSLPSCLFPSESWMSRFRWWLGGPIQIHHQTTLSRRKPLKRPINKKLWVKEAVSPAFYNYIGDTFGSKKTFQSCGSWNRKQLAKLSALCSLKLRSRPGMR